MMSLSSLPVKPGRGNTPIVRRMSMETYMVRIYTGPLSPDLDYVSVEAEKVTTADEVVRVAVDKLNLSDPNRYELAEVLSTSGQLCKERRLEIQENPVRVQLLWPKMQEYELGHGHTGYRFYIRKKNPENSNRTSAWIEYSDPNPVDNFLTAFLKQPTSNKEYEDLCNLPDLNEKTLLENIKSRFNSSHIYTYVGSILIALNPFKFFPIYNPKYVKMYQNKRLGELPPHIFAIADAAFYTMLRSKKNQCIVISGESGSGKTESTNLLLHHLTALSHKGLHGSGVEQTILGAGPVLEAFGNAKTVHNNNSSRFGKFIQVNYKENGMVHGAIVEKYLLEKSRIVSQARDERNYHVFYCLLEGADTLEREKLHLGKPADYFYLRQSNFCSWADVDEDEFKRHEDVFEFTRLKQSMELVGFSQVTQARIFGVLSAVLHLGNVEFKKKGDQHHDESVTIVNPETLAIVSKLLMVKKRTLSEALTQKKTVAGDETVVMTHRMEHAVATRDAMAKCLYGALFDWIVLKVNQALLAKRHNSEHLADAKTGQTNYVRHTGNSIGVLDIFGFEDFRWNSFEQFCINYANEHLQYYFNQHIFKFEQEEYKKEGIEWMNIEFIDNTGCLELFSKKTKGLFPLLDEECNFPGASNETLLTKFHHHHSKGNVYYEAPQRREMAFVVLHYAGKVKYHVKDFREKNSDQIRMDIVANMKSSSLAFVRELMGVDPVAVLRWTIIKTLIKSVFAFVRAGKTYRERGGPDSSVVSRRKHSNVDPLNIPELNTSPYLSPGCKPPPLQSQSISPHTSMHVITRREHHHLSPNYADDSYAENGDSEIFLSSKRHSGPLRSPVDRYMSEDDARVMRRATRVMMKNKSFKPRARPPTMFSDIKTLKAIANRTMYVGGKMNSKTRPPSVSAQFQWSLSRLMSTLNQANPFFIRCIKSNAEKMPCQFDDVLVTRQLRYTGMLATVRIRQSGYNYRLTFEEFVKQYKIILPKGLQSGKKDVAMFLETLNMNHSNYQIGKTKVFLRENEKLDLDNSLHCAIMKRVVTIQRWVKTKVERKNYLQLREQTILIQKHVRKFVAQRNLEIIRDAILCMQRWYRGYKQRRSYALVRQSAIRIQAYTRGYLQRKRFKTIEAELRRLKEEREAEKERLRLEREAAKQALEDMHSSTSDEGVLMKENSSDELERYNKQYHRNDSEESSGILDDSESDTLSEAKSRDESISSPPPTPTSQGPEINIESLQGHRDEYLHQSGKSPGRVQNISKIFQSPICQSIDDSPTNEIQAGSPLSEEQKRQIEETLKRQGASGSVENVHKSPFKWARDLVASSGPHKRKQSDDDDSEHSATSKHSSQHSSHPVGGIAVLPLSPTSKEDNTSTFAPDEPESKKAIQKKRRTRKEKEDKENRPVEKCWNVAKTSQWQYPEEFVIAETYELQLLDEFIGKKHNLLAKDTPKKESQFDVVFKKCLKSFHTELKSTYSVHMQREERSCNIKYRDLFAIFEKIMDASCKEENVDSEFPKTICINAFRGYLDEFRNTVNSKKKESKFKKKRDRTNKREKQKKDTVEYQGHKFSVVQFGIPTFCELCSNIIWIMEKGHVCQICKYACHKKCTSKSTIPCKGAQDMNNQRIVGTMVFSVPLVSLVDVEHDEKIPVFMDNLIMLIETHGLFTEGIYRKSGAAPKINKLKTMLDSGVKEISIDEFPIHVLTSTLKTFFRELPEPVLTFDFYDEFVQASEIHDEKEAIQVLYSLIEKLPKVNHDVLERLIFHLSRVAQHEKINKMSVNGLAIIFAPCLLRTEKVVQAQDLLAQVHRQQVVVEKILQEQLRKIKSKLQDIDTLESAEATASERLSDIRASMRTARVKMTVRKAIEAPPSLSEDPEALEEQEQVIESHIKSIRQERDILTNTLPMFEYRHSSDDEMLSTDDIESIDDAEFVQDDASFDTPAKTTTQSFYLTKQQADKPRTQLLREASISKQRSLDDIEGLESMKTDYTRQFPDKNPDSDQLTYDSDSSCSPSLRNKSVRKPLLDSLDLHESDSSRCDEFTRKKVGKYFKMSGAKASSALSRNLDKTGSLEDMTVAHDTTITHDSVLLRKPKRYDPELHPGKPKNRYILSRMMNSPVGRSDSPRKKFSLAPDGERLRKQSLPDIRYDPASSSPDGPRVRKQSLPGNDHGSSGTSPKSPFGSPQIGEASAARIRPLILTDSKRVLDYSTLTVTEKNSDSEDEIMV